MTDLIEFLNARLDEDEETAKATAPSGRRLSWYPSHEINEEGTPVHWVLSAHDVAAVAHAMGLERETGGAVADHIARHDPARALREVEAKRAIIADHLACEKWNEDARASRGGEREICMTLRALVAVYGGHPDYRREWAL